MRRKSSFTPSVGKTLWDNPSPPPCGAGTGCGTGTGSGAGVTTGGFTDADDVGAGAGINPENRRLQNEVDAGIQFSLNKLLTTIAKNH
jgi:hypothetical protein